MGGRSALIASIVSVGLVAAWPAAALPDCDVDKTGRIWRVVHHGG